MTIRHLLLLQIFLAIGLSLVFLLPKNPELRPAAVNMELPSFFGEWYGVDQEVSKGERDILGADTEFARKLYNNGRGDEVFASVVLSGPDMNNSIHRPERCLPAQGWTTSESETVTVPLMGRRHLSATRLQNLKSVPLQEGGDVKIKNLNYYWFVGHTESTPSHLARTFFDIRDRVLKGYNQRWAYVTVSATVTKDVRRFGRSTAETEQIVESFIAAIYPHLSLPSGTSPAMGDIRSATASLSSAKEIAPQKLEGEDSLRLQNP